MFTIHTGKLKAEKDRYGDCDNDEDDNRQYCQSCLQYGIYSKLKRRIYKVEQADGEPKMVPASVPDADKFRQCFRCGDIVPLYEVNTESKIEDFVETIDNPFDSNPGNMQSFTPGIGKSNRINKSKSIYKRKKQYAESIKDPDIKDEILKGNQVTINSC